MTNDMNFCIDHFQSLLSDNILNYKNNIKILQQLDNIFPNNGLKDLIFLIHQECNTVFDDNFNGYNDIQIFDLNNKIKNIFYNINNSTDVNKDIILEALSFRLKKSYYS